MEILQVPGVGECGDVASRGWGVWKSSKYEVGSMEMLQVRVGSMEMLQVGGGEYGDVASPWSRGV